MICRIGQKPPYYAVIFTSEKNVPAEGYEEMATKMMELARSQDGFLGVDSAREDVGITVSYWRDLESIAKWRNHAEHTLAREKGRREWYQSFSVRIAKVEREYGM